MATKKQARAAQRRRYELLEARVAARAARRHRTRQIAAAVTAGTFVLGGGAIALVTVGPLGSDPAPSASPTPTATGPAPVPTPSIIVDEGGEGFPMDLAEGRTWTATIVVNGDPVTLELDGAAAPLAVGSFVNLAQQGFFDGTACHRLMNTGVYFLQCGDPEGTGFGGPPYRFGPVENAPADNVYPAGTIAMARIGGDGYSIGSQFFIVYQDSSFPSDAAGGYTVFGTVTSGLDVIAAIGAAGTTTGTPEGPPIEPVVLTEVTVE